MEAKESISASIVVKDELAKVVLMPGDPLRAKAVAEKFMTDVVCFNDTRNMLGFTGTYKGKRISVMGSGMGVPSMTLYARAVQPVRRGSDYPHRIGRRIGYGCQSDGRCNRTGSFEQFCVRQCLRNSGTAGSLRGL